MGSKAKIIPVTEAIIKKMKEDIAKVKWLYLQIEIVMLVFNYLGSKRTYLINPFPSILLFKFSEVNSN